MYAMWVNSNILGISLAMTPCRKDWQMELIFKQNFPIFIRHNQKHLQKNETRYTDIFITLEFFHEHLVRPPQLFLCTSVDLNAEPNSLGRTVCWFL
jgi:hypothetical protein